MKTVTIELVAAAAFRLLRDLAATRLICFVPAPSVEPRKTRPIGTLNGQILCPPDFDTMGQEEIIAMFEGEP